MKTFTVGERDWAQLTTAKVAGNYDYGQGTERGGQWVESY